MRRQTVGQVFSGQKSLLVSYIEKLCSRIEGLYRCVACVIRNGWKGGERWTRHHLEKPLVSEPRNGVKWSNSRTHAL